MSSSNSSTSTSTSTSKNGFQINPADSNNVVFYWDELHKKDGKERSKGRMITAAVHFDPDTFVVKYGATIFRKDTEKESWIRKNHRWTAKQRLAKRPLTFKIILDTEEIEMIRQEWREKMQSPSLQQEVLERSRERNSSRERNETMESLQEKVVESHVRDYVLQELKYQVRQGIKNDGTCGTRL